MMECQAEEFELKVYQNGSSYSRNRILFSDYGRQCLTTALAVVGSRYEAPRNTVFLQAFSRCFVSEIGE
jgi:hypothetical protein